MTREPKFSNMDSLRNLGEDGVRTTNATFITFSRSITLPRRSATCNNAQLHHFIFMYLQIRKFIKSSGILPSVVFFPWFPRHTIYPAFPIEKVKGIMIPPFFDRKKARNNNFTWLCTAHSNDHLICIWIHSIFNTGTGTHGSEGMKVFVNPHFNDKIARFFIVVHPAR